MTTPQIALGAEVPALSVVLQHNGDVSFAIEVTDPAGGPANLAGRVATIETDAGAKWTATVDGSKFVWVITAAQASALGRRSSCAALIVTDASGGRAVWARGRVEVRQ